MDKTTATRLNMAVSLTSDLLKEHGIRGVSIKTNTNKTRVGVCKFDRYTGHPKTIEFSRVIAAHTSTEDILETARHEVAHAIAGVKAGHGPAWRQACRQVGLMNPERCFNKSSTGMTAHELNRKIAAYKFVCVSCGWDMPFHRMTQNRRWQLHNASCPKCRGKLKLG